ncbi:hypothetical protein HV832_16675 [Undibacterium oligocarboniphilum]|uniref:DNA methylase N-4/N-6 domain-containing protein n=1 Tax=Undibacterium oligocarboniphilum TaxID=666702 RepID=A0A850QSW1_9BURK|nr:hypothetical protein [Undibacterium oligocarboniphilum]NVO79454.1 hypothetical protein [Undibacterium oligocarboniphilum]
MTGSILSFPERGPWGSSSWRGNCSGHVYRALFQSIKPASFCDPMSGSGTAIQVAEMMGIEAFGLDLHSGFNILRDSIVKKIDKEVDLVLSHCPYSGMVLYSGQQWGSEPHPDDLSRCHDDNDFCEKMQIAMINQREATKIGGYYGTIVGDWRRGGVYSSYQAEIISRLPKDELAGVLIKAQHNMQSNAKSYKAMKLPFITHEYILIFKRKKCTTMQFLQAIAIEQAQRLRGTWRSIVRHVMIQLGGQAKLEVVYQTIQENAPDKLQRNPHWKDKIRQVLNSSGDYFSEERGVWKLA